MKYRSLWHMHIPILPYFDKNNEGLRKKIRKYLDFLRMNKIDIINFTWHSGLCNRNDQVKEGEVNFFKLNVLPLDIFKILKQEAKNYNILVIPSLEVDAFINVQGKKQKIHILLIHEDGKTIFNNNLFYRDDLALNEVLENIPKGSVTVIPHPWRFGTGITYYVGLEFTEKIIKKYNLIVEDGGYYYPIFYCMDVLKKKFPFLNLFKWFRKSYFIFERNFKFKGLGDFKSLYGLDAHAACILPENTGFVEFDIRGGLTSRKILDLVEKGKGVPAIPKKIEFFAGFFWILSNLGAFFAEEFILKILLGIRSFFNLSKTL